MRGLSRQSFGERYGISQEGLNIWFDQSDVRSAGDAQNWYDIGALGKHADQTNASLQPDLSGAPALAGSTRKTDVATGHKMEMDNNTPVYGTNTFTYEAWVYLTALTSNAYIIDFDSGGGSGSKANRGGWYVYILTSTSQFYNGIETTSLQSINSGINLGLNTWHHIVSIKNGTSYKTYTNNVAGSTMTLGGSSIDWSANYSADKVNLFSHYKNGGWSGCIDGYTSSMRVWNRELSAAEIQRIYLADKVRHGGL